MSCTKTAALALCDVGIAIVGGSSSGGHLMEALA